MPSRRRILVTGGVRSGKSLHAESLLRDAGRRAYVAPGKPTGTGDPDWDERVRLHRERRGAEWTTIETQDVAGVLDRTEQPVLVDCLGTWLTGLVDDAGAWEHLEAATGVARGATSQLVAALDRARHDTVLVTNEVGFGIVPESASGRWFRDELGRVNAAVAAACDGVHLVVAGRVLDLSAAPAVAGSP